MQPASGKAKPGRRRIACNACSANKQKCDGATRHPCRRCELYGVACEYPDGQVPKGAVRVKPGAGAVGDTAASGGATPQPSVAAGPSGVGAAGAGDLAAALREITARLQAIEAGLDNDRRSGIRLSAPAPSASLVLPPVNPQLETQRPSDSAQSLEQLDMPPDSNPLQVLVATLDEVERMNKDEQLMDDSESSEGGRPKEMTDLEQLEYWARRVPRSNKPDVFSRGLMTLEDVDLAFAFYRQRIQPWIPVVERRVPLVVRAGSPFLFHAILLVTDFYNTSTSPRAKEVYAGLTSIVNELLAAQVFAPDPSVFNPDLVRALLLLLYYKPVQTTFFSHRGLKSSSRIAHASKVNALSSLMIHSLIHRTASFLNMHQTPAFLQVYLENPDAAANAKLPPFPDVLSNYRLWCSLIAADALGSLQSGRMSWADPTSALRCARRFAAAANDPTDVRRAAVLELYSIVTVPPSAGAATRPVSWRLENLGRINTELEQWRGYWKDRLAEAQIKGDPLAYTVVRTLACFVLLAVDGAVFTRWTLERKKDLEEGKEGRPKLTNEDWKHLQIAADAAQSAIFAVSLEAKDLDQGLSGAQWPKVSGDKREPLQLNLAVVEDFKTALDTMTCIAFVYSLLFLVRMASAGLISCNIVTRQYEYEGGADLGVPQPLTTGDKLPLLLELGAAFLNGIAPNPDHPAKKHAVLVQTILRVGLGQHTPNGVPSPFSPIGAPPPAPVSASSSQQQQQTGSYYPSQSQSQKPVPPPIPSIPQLPQNPPYSGATSQGRQPMSNNYDSWLWDTNTSTSGGGGGGGALKMTDGSLVMPNLANSGSGGAAASGPPMAPGVAVSTSLDGTAATAGQQQQQQRAVEDPAQAMASLLSEVNPFLDDFYATHSTLNSNTFNDDFGLSSAGPGEVNQLDWSSFGDVSGGAAGGTGASWMGMGGM
ncbi:hypothetical protein JCM1840_003563 [Sporobolomyces johnsonii]